MFVITITERTPTRDNTDINTYHVTVSDLIEAAGLIENFEINFGVLVSMTIAPAK